MFANLLLFAITLSIDSFGVGITYGIRNTKISLGAKFILFLIAFFIVLLSLSLGSILLQLLPAYLVTILGSVLLFSMGLWFVFQSFKPEKKYSHSTFGQSQDSPLDCSIHKPEEVTLPHGRLKSPLHFKTNSSYETKNPASNGAYHPKTFQFFIKSFGITIKIIKNPILSDFDASQTIDKKEAIYLGLAMSADSFVSSMGISMLGNFSILFPLLVATCQLVFLSFGNYFGKRITAVSHLSPSIWSRISGILLMLLSVLKLF